MIVETGKNGEFLIKIKKGEKIRVMIGSSTWVCDREYIDIKCEKDGSLEKMFLTTAYTAARRFFSFVEASQILLGISPKRCKCGDERGGLAHAHPLYIPFEFED